MELDNPSLRIHFASKGGFARALRENIDAVAEELHVIRVECEIMGDESAARFFEATGDLVRAFALARRNPRAHDRYAPTVDHF